MKPQIQFLFILSLVLLTSSCKKPCYQVLCEDDVTKKSFEACKVCPDGICPSGWILCNGECTKISNDINNCGKCGNQCGPGKTCVNGRCVPTCPNPTSTVCFGGCHDLQTDVNHCGACGKKCPPGKVCINGVCQCPVNTVDCQNGCVDLRTSRAHCGSCGRICPDGQICQNGRCITTCPKPTPDVCFGGCYNLQTDANHCGTCGNKCPDGQKCVNGKCQ